MTAPWSAWKSGSRDDRVPLKDSIECSAVMVKKLTLNSFGKMKGWIGYSSRGPPLTNGLPASGLSQFRKIKNQPLHVNPRMSGWVCLWPDPEVTQSAEFRVAVGTLVAERPPHRTARAGFPHTAPTSGE